MMRNTLGLAVCLVVACLASAQTLINGAGATFPFPMYSKWFDEYHKKNSSYQINYQPLGSGAGIKQVTDGTVDFGASDAILTDEQLKAFKEKHGGADLLCLPTVLGAVAITYNIPNVTESLNFTPEALAGIYFGKITKWNDGAIASANPKVKLPATDIVVVHRAEASGTTFCFTDYLSKVSPDWSKGPGTNANPSWPTGLGGKGSDGVSGQVKQTPGAIGYVELLYALQNKMAVGKVKNSSGGFITPSLASVTAAASSAASTIPDDFRVSIVNAPGKEAYPISTFTWLLIPSKIDDATKKTAIVGFLRWMLAEGQNMAEPLDYAKLPKPVVAKEMAAIDKAFGPAPGAKKAAAEPEKKAADKSKKGGK